MAKKFISDEEMAALEAAGQVETPKKKIISDAEMAAMEAEEQSFLDKETPLGPSLRETGQTLHDGALGATQGIMFNAADELGGAVSAGLDSAVEGISGLIPGTDAHKLKQLEAEGFVMPEESLADKYKMYQQNAEKEFKAAEERSPIVYTGGQIAGGIGSGIAAGGALGVNAASKAKPILDIAKDQGKLKAGIELLKRSGVNYAKASPLMALEGVTGSEGNLIGGTDEEQAQVGKDVLSNMALGVPAIVGMQGVSDVVIPGAKKGIKNVADWAGDKMEGSPLARQAQKIYEYGKQGINPASEKHAEKLFAQEIDNSAGLTKEIFEADDKLGKGISQAIQKADASGKMVDINSVVDDSFQSLAKSYEQMEAIGANARGRDIFNKIATRSSTPLAPSEAKVLLDDVDAFINKFKAIGVDKKTETDNLILSNLMKFRKNLSNTMKDQIPEYKVAAGRFEEFRRLVPETIMSGKTPTDISDIYMGSLRNPELKIFQKMEDLTTGATSTSQGGIPIKQAWSNMKKGLGEFETNDAARRMADPSLENPLKRSSQEYEKIIRDSSDDAIGRRSLMSAEESRSLGSNLITAGTGIGQASKSKFLYGLNLAGQAAGSNTAKNIGKRTRQIYNLPAEKLNQAADRLSQIKGLETLGKALKDGLANGDTAKKNAALFSIMQNPNASLIFDENEED